MADANAKFGSCCDSLHECLSPEFESFFRIEDNGVLYLTVGMIATKDGPGYFDQAVIFCPFCGTKLQDPQAIANAAGG